MVKFVNDNDLQFADFDGCQFGLRSCNAGAEFKFLMKPWRFATNIPEVFDGFNGLFCPGTSPGHVHDITRGQNAKHSQGYTRELVTKLHRCIKDHVTGPNSWWTPS